MDLARIMIGEWRLDRHLNDARAGVQARFCGRLSVQADPEGLLLCETGQWRGAPWGDLPATRSDLWRLGDQVEVHFSDGRFFHAFTPVMQGRAPVRHLCGDDMYRGLYHFDLPHEWHLEWAVNGPRKDYVTRTHFTRLAD